jgi:hypothetical protein
MVSHVAIASIVKKTASAIKTIGKRWYRSMKDIFQKSQFVEKVAAQIMKLKKVIGGEKIQSVQHAAYTAVLEQVFFNTRE